MSSVVLDASAVLAFALGEKGSELVASRMVGALMSAVNYSEVLKKAIERGGSPSMTGILLSRSQVEIVAFDEEQAARTAELFATTRELGLSFADRSCLALGIVRSVPVFTADARLAKAKVPIEVRMIR